MKTNSDLMGEAIDRAPYDDAARCAMQDALEEEGVSHLIAVEVATVRMHLARQAFIAARREVQRARVQRAHRPQPRDPRGVRRGPALRAVAAAAGQLLRAIAADPVTRGRCVGLTALAAAQIDLARALDAAAPLLQE